MTRPGTYLEAFEVHNYALFGCERLTLHRDTTVLVGRNDVGKSLLLQALYLYGAIQQHGFRGPLGDKSFHTSVDKETRFTADWSVDGVKWRHIIRLNVDTPEERVECDDRFWSWNPKSRTLTTRTGEHTAKEIERYQTLANIDTSRWKLDTDVEESIYGPLAVLASFTTPTPYLFEPSALSTQASLDLESPRRNGYGWSLWMQEIINRRDDSLTQLEETVRRLFPFFGRVLVREKRLKIEREVSEIGRAPSISDSSSSSLDPLEMSDSLIDMLRKQGSVREVFVELRDISPEEQGERIDAHEVSSGILLTLAHLALVYADKASALLLLEEPENGLNPKITLDMMQTMLRVVVDRGKQLILTTHNAWWLDLVSEDAIRVITRDSNGSHIHVPDHEGLRRLRDELDIYPSEVMSIHGPEALVTAGTLKDLAT